MSYYYNLMPNHQNYATNLDVSSTNYKNNNNSNSPSQFTQPVYFQQPMSYSYDYNTNDFIPNVKRERITSDSLLSLSSQVDFSNIENKSSYKNNTSVKSTSYSYRPSQPGGSSKRERSSSGRRSSSADLNKNNYEEGYHEINSNNKAILLPDLWTDGCKKKTPEKIHDFFNGKLLNKTNNNNNNSNSSLDLIEMKKEFRIKKIWRKVFS